MRLYVVFFLLLFGLFVSAHDSTNELGMEYAIAVDSIFDEQGNLIDIEKYDDSFTNISSTFQQFPGPVKAILNDQRIQIDMEFTPSQMRRFGLVIENEKIRSFTLGNMNDATLFLSLDLQTMRDIQDKGAFQELGKAMKDGRIKVRTPDFFQGIVIWFYLLSV